MNQAYLEKASQAALGYFTGSKDALAFTIQIEDTMRHRMRALPVFRGPVLEAMSAAAKRIDPSAHAFGTSNPAAIEAWGHRDFERAAELDPDFGAAWLAWAETLVAQHDAPRALDVASRALARSSLRSPIDRARIELFAANLRDDPEARVKALSDLARLLPGDAPALENFAQAEMNARHFREAAALFRQSLRIEPANAAAENLLGYAEAFAGNLDAARQALEDYGKDPSQKPNSLDSLGEVFFLHGRFAEAEKYFSQTPAGFMGGADILKSAYARWLAGDLQAADKIAQDYFAYRRSQRDPLLAWRESVWLYSTGRRDQAIAKLNSLSDTPLAKRQLAVWNEPLPSDLDLLKKRWERTPPASDSLPRVLYAAALLKAGHKEDSRKLAGLWPLPLQPSADPVLDSVVFPVYLQVRRGLGL